MDQTAIKLALDPHHEYTRNWTRKYIETWTEHLAPLADRPINFLEIGVFEARSSMWFLDNVLAHPESRYWGIDPWELEPMSPKRFPRRDGVGQQMIETVEVRARRHLAPYSAKVTLLKGRSADVLPTLHRGEPWLDVAYIDGVHHYNECLADSRLTWPLVKRGGIIFWDDVIMKSSTEVKEALDAFLAEHHNEWRLLWKHKQVGVRKL